MPAESDGMMTAHLPTPPNLLFRAATAPARRHATAHRGRAVGLETAPAAGPAAGRAVGPATAPIISAAACAAAGPADPAARAAAGVDRSTT